MKQYLSFIRKADFTDLFKYGKLYVNRDTTTAFDCDVKDLPTNPGVFDELVKNTNSFDSSFVYLIIHYQKNDNDNPCDVNIEELCHIYPLDSEAKSNFISSFDERIRIEEPIWADAVFKLQQKQLFNECRKGAQNIWNIFKFDEPITKCENIITDDILAEVVSQLFENRRPKGELPIWVYLLRYERHSSYPKNTIGFFLDTYNIICNNWKRDEFFEDDIKGTNIYAFLQSKYDTNSGFGSIYADLCATEECKPFLQLVDSFESRVDFFKIAFWYLYLRDKYKNGLVYEPNFINEAKIKIGEEFQYAAYLLGLKLGHEHTYDCLYEELPLAIFKSKAQLYKEREAKRLELERFQEEERRREEERRFREEEERKNKYGKRGYGDDGYSYGGYSSKWGDYSNPKGNRSSKGKGKGTSKEVIPSRMNTEDKYVSPVPNSNKKENPSLSPEIVSHVVPTTTPEKKEEHVLTPDQVDVTQESSTTSSSTGEVSVQETVTTANVDPTPSGNIEATPKRTLPHSYPVTMVKLTKDGKVKKSPKPIQVHSHQEFIGKLDEGWVLKPVEQLTMFNDNNEIQ